MKSSEKGSKYGTSGELNTKLDKWDKPSVRKELVLPDFDLSLSLCAQTDPEQFFPEKGGTSYPAKKICSECEVRIECLEWALKNDEQFGIWGGLTALERNQLKGPKPQRGRGRPRTYKPIPLNPDNR